MHIVAHITRHSASNIKLTVLRRHIRLKVLREIWPLAAAILAVAISSELSSSVLNTEHQLLDWMDQGYMVSMLINFSRHLCNKLYRNLWHNVVSSHFVDNFSSNFECFKWIFWLYLTLIYSSILFGFTCCWAFITKDFS